MSLAEYVRGLLMQCPAISKDSPDMTVDFLDTGTLHYSIEGEPTAPIVTRYRFGGALRRFSFALVARCLTIDDGDRVQNAENYEQLSLWLDEVSRMRRLPPMAEGNRPLRMEAVGAPYLTERDEDGITAVYMMQIELTYEQKARID